MTSKDDFVANISAIFRFLLIKILSAEDSIRIALGINDSNNNVLKHVSVLGKQCHP